MASAGTEKQQPPVEVPQYEEYKTASCIMSALRLTGGIGAVFSLIVLLFLRLWVGEEGRDVCLWLFGAFLALFLIPTLLDRRRTRENRQIEARNQKKYEQYRLALEASEESK